METEVSEVFFRLSIPHTSHGGQCPISLWQKAQSSKGAKENLNKRISLKKLKQCKFDMSEQSSPLPICPISI